MLRWIIKGLLSSKVFHKALEDKIGEYYKHYSLVNYRVWGDESRVFLGKHVQVNNALFNTVSGEIRIGDYTFFGHNVSIYTGTHDYRQKNLKRQQEVPSSGRDVVIGKGVWVASNVIIVAPCNIGDNCVIGAGVVVTGNIEQNTIYTCSCEKVIKRLDCHE